MSKRMMLLYLLLPLSATTFALINGFGQQYIGSKKNHALKELNHYVLHDSLEAIIKTSDSTIVFMLRDSSYRKNDIWLYFNKEERCYRQEDYFDCDLCYQKRLKANLANRRFKWKKLSDAAYLSKRYKILMLFNREGHGDFIIQCNRPSDKDFNFLLKKAL